MKKIRSIEDYFVSKFNEAQDKIEELKIENNHLREELKKKTESTESTESTEPVVLPTLAVRYSVSFYSYDIKADNKAEWAKAVESNDFEEIMKMYMTKNSYRGLIRTHICNVIIKVVNVTFYGNVYVNGDANRILIYDNWLEWFETNEEAQEEVRRLIRERLSELEKGEIKNDI